MKHLPACARAFTLMELLIVIVILSIAGAGMVPVFLGNTDHYRLKDSAVRLADILVFCQSMAVFEGRAFRLYIEREEGLCRVFFEKDPIEEPGIFTLYRVSGYSSSKLHDGVVFQGLSLEQGSLEESGVLEEAYIEFRPDGTGDRAVVVVGNEQGESFSIFVSSLTGRVRLSEGDYLAEETEAEEKENGALRMEDEALNMLELEAGRGSR